MPKLIHLWSSPRNVSTALLYSFARHPDLAVVDEPLYAHYLLRQPTDADHPGREAIIASQNGDGNAVLRELAEHPTDRPYLVCKQMTHHLVDIDHSPLKGAKNFLLLRDPREILQSFSRVVDNVELADLGLPQQQPLYDYLRKYDALTGIIDAKRLLLDPAATLNEVCRRCGLAFDEGMLSWPAGPIPEDGVWAEYWYTNVHKSTGFAPYKAREITVTPEQFGIDPAEFQAAIDWYEARAAEAI